MGSFHGPYYRGNRHHRHGSNAEPEVVDQQDVPEPRPSHCPSKLTYQHLIFARKNFVMEQDVESEAIVVETARESQFVSIHVDYQVSNRDNTSKVDVLFVGTGKLNCINRLN